MLYHSVSSEIFLTCSAQNILRTVLKPRYKMKDSVCCPTELSIFIEKKKIARTASITLDKDMTLLLALQEIGFQHRLIFSKMTSYITSSAT